MGEDMIADCRFLTWTFVLVEAVGKFKCGETRLWYDLIFELSCSSQSGDKSAEAPISVLRARLHNFSTTRNHRLLEDLARYQKIFISSAFADLPI
jgi:hypothetical protein